jgi:SAM-dependent methyltransferase
MTDPRRYAPATQRNREAILAVLARHLPARGLVLELASGTGEHIAHFAAALPNLVFQPSDPDAASRASVDAWAAIAGCGNLRPAIALDAAAARWPIDAADAVLCINMIHIAPWTATIGLVHRAARILGPGGILFLYGPFRRAGSHTAPSNEAFDRDLRARNPEWGVRDLEAVADLAAASGFAAPLIEAMPANNLSAIFRRLSGEP